MALARNLVKSSLKNCKRGFILFNTKLCRQYSYHVFYKNNQNDKLNINCSLDWPSRRYFRISPISLKVVSFNLSDIGEGIKEVIVKEWFVKVGDKVAQFDKICEVQSDKASVTITSRYDGKITKLYHDIEGKALVGHPLVDIEIENADKTTEVESLARKPEKKTEVESLARKPEKKTEVESLARKHAEPDSVEKWAINKSLATPAVRRMAAEYKLKLSDVAGTGKKGRVLKEDVINHLKKFEDGVLSSSSTTLEKLTTDRTEPISGYMKAMVKSMNASQRIPHLIYGDEINMVQLKQLVSRLKLVTMDRNVKITFMPFLIKATSMALEQFPIINSSVDDNCEHITYKSMHNIGIAMDTPNGLVVPNIKNVQSLSIIKIAHKLNRLQKLGRKGGFGLDDLTGGTITLSNIGAIGGTYCSPKILPPEVVIAAIGRLQVVPRFNEIDEVEKCEIMNISWSADHRVIDGATIARFSNVWKCYIENPDVLMLN